MKKVLIVIIATVLSFSYSYSQNEIGIKLGLSSYDLPGKMYTDSKNLKITIKDASYGFQFGAFARIGLFGFYIQPELDFNSNTVHYKLEKLNQFDTLNSIRTSTYRNIDIPILFMISPSIFRLYAGPVGHYLINGVSDFTERDKVKEILSNLKYGYQIGIGASIKNITLDIRYEGSISRSIKTFEIDGKEFNLDDSKSRYIFSIWYGFK